MIVAALGLFTAVTWPGVPLAIAMLNAERPPALLSDIHGWDKPEEAKAFRAKFHSGVPEAELLAWLKENRFSIDHRGGRAEHLIEGLPCNMLARVRWSANGGVLRYAQATLSEAGCL